jgi:hypothetical protein
MDCRSFATSEQRCWTPATRFGFLHERERLFRLFRRDEIQLIFLAASTISRIARKGWFAGMRSSNRK